MTSQENRTLSLHFSARPSVMPEILCWASMFLFLLDSRLETAGMTREWVVATVAGMAEAWGAKCPPPAGVGGGHPELVEGLPGGTVENRPLQPHYMLAM